MKAIQAIRLTGLLAAVAITAVGCNSEQASTSADVNAAAKELYDKSKDVPAQPDPAVVDRNTGQGTGAAATAAPKPGRNR